MRSRRGNRSSWPGWRGGRRGGGPGGGARHLSMIREAAPQAQVEQTVDRGRVVRQAENADVIVGWNVPREAVAQARRLRWIHPTAAGGGQLPPPGGGQGGILANGRNGALAG